MKRKTSICFVVAFLSLISLSGQSNNNQNSPSWLELEKKYYAKAGDMNYDEIRAIIDEALTNVESPYHPVWTKMRLQFIKMLMDEYRKQETLSKDIRIYRSK